MVKKIACICAFVLVASGASLAQQQSATGNLTDVTGTWVMLVAGHQIGLELEQKDTKVEGVMHAMGQRVPLIGEYKDRALTLKGERPEDGSGHDGKGGAIVATMLDDGT